MIKASGSLQDLRSGLYGKRKTEWPWRHAKASDGRGGVVDGRSGHLNLGDGSRAVLESDSDRIGPINLAAKCAGARSAGNPHAACEVAGAGNGATELAKRARRGKPRTRPSERPDGPPRQFPTLPGWHTGKAGRWHSRVQLRSSALCGEGTMEVAQLRSEGSRGQFNFIVPVRDGESPDPDPGL